VVARRRGIGPWPARRCAILADARRTSSQVLSRRVSVSNLSVVRPIRLASAGSALCGRSSSTSGDIKFRSRCEKRRGDEMLFLQLRSRGGGVEKPYLFRWKGPTEHRRLPRAITPRCIRCDCAYWLDSIADAPENERATRSRRNCEESSMTARSDGDVDGLATVALGGPPYSMTAKVSFLR